MLGLLLIYEGILTPTLTVGTKGGRDQCGAHRHPGQAHPDRLGQDLRRLEARPSTSDPARTLAQVKNHYYHVLRSCGITRADGLTGHGLRHGYANDRYQQLAGQPSPVRSGTTSDPDTDQAARLEVAEELGHSRESVTTDYLGR